MIRLEDLKKTYDKNTRHANRVLHGMSFTLPDTGFICILGASGCGKTSLLNAIGGLDVFDSGKIITDTATITKAMSSEMERERNAAFGYIFQNYYLLSEHSAAYNVYLGMHSTDLTKKEKMARVKDALERVDMLRYRKRPVGELSGGQQQRVAIARALARRPRVIFADEPTGNLDEANTMNICSILKELSRESLVVMVTHEERIARFFADRIITLDAGNIVSDTTDWDRGTIDAGAKDTVYAGDYAEKNVSHDGISLRLLTAENAKAVDLTVISEGERIIIKVNDPRIVLCSEMAAAPRLAEGKRPVLNAESFGEAKPLPTEKKEAVKKQKKTSRGLDLGMLMSEARSLVSGKKLRKFGTGAFIILLTAMMALSIADMATVARIDPEDFVTADSHILRFNFERGGGFTNKYDSLSTYIKMFQQHIDDGGLDFDYIPTTAGVLQYRDSIIPQFGNIYMNFKGYSWARTSRLDESTLIMGRMPERYDEIVIDRWVLDAALSEDGILQNVIPNAEYLLNKQLVVENKTTKLTIVGICDAGEPTMYMSQEAMLAFASCGSEVITLSEYKRITGDDSIEALGLHECVAIKDNAPALNGWTGIGAYVGSDYSMTMVNAISDVDDSIGAKMIIADEALDPLYRTMIDSLVSFNVWCADKDAMYDRLGMQFPEALEGKLDIEVSDKYGWEYAEYEERTNMKVDARTIVTATVILTGAIMLYLMQRSKIRERMDLVAVYRLLGIPKRNLMVIFAVESLILTLRYGLPTVFVIWIGLKGMSMIAAFESVALYYPIWAAGLTIAAIAVYRLLIAVLPVARLLSKPPARLAAKYDF